MMQKKYRIDENGFKTVCTPDHDVVITCGYLNMPMKQLSKKLNISDTCLRKRLQQLGLSIPPCIIEQRKKDSQIKLGAIPANKGKKMKASVYERCKGTVFKKGHVPANSKGVKDGDVTLRKDKSGRLYKFIRLSLGKWIPLHIANWEKENVKVPKGYCIWFRNGDTLNCDINDLELITRGENMKRNSAALRLTDGYVAQCLARKKGGRGLCDKNLKQLVLQDPSLIELKRHQLKLKRTIYGHKKINQRAGTNEG